MVDRALEFWAKRSFCWFAVQIQDGPFIGFTGLHLQQFEAHFTPAVEIGWRLSQANWGHGYATEAARAAVGWGFAEKGLESIVSFTVPANTRSRAMQRLGMRHDPAENFDHPSLPIGHTLRRHVLYRLQATDWPG